MAEPLNTKDFKQIEGHPDFYFDDMKSGAFALNVGYRFMQLEVTTLGMSHASVHIENVAGGLLLGEDFCRAQIQRINEHYGTDFTPVKRIKNH